MATVLNPKKPDPTQLQTIGTATPAGPATTSQAAPAAPKPQGSGRFTNIQKYLGANQQGGQQLANKIGSNIQSGLSKEQEATKKYNDQLGDSVRKANAVAQQGSGFQQKLGQIGTDIGANKVKSFDEWKAEQAAPKSLTPEYIDTLKKNYKPSTISGFNKSQYGNADLYNKWQDLQKTNPFVPGNPYPEELRIAEENWRNSMSPEEKKQYSNMFDPKAQPAIDPRHDINMKTSLTPEQQYAAYQQSMLTARPNQNVASIDAFTQSPDFNQFQNIQAGRGIDENLLANQQQRLANQANVAASQAATAQQQLGNETGRFDLLRKTFGGAAKPGYGQGQQRLDQMLLGQGGGLGKVQSDVAAKNRELQTEAKAAGAQKADVGRITQQEKDLMSGINTQAGKNEQSYIDMLNSYVDPLNQQRATEVQNLGNALSSYNSPYNPANPGLSESQMANLGLTDKNTGVYNVFKDQPYLNPTGATPEEQNRNRVSYAADIGRNADTSGMGYKDVANQSDVNRYSQLSKMLGANAGDPRLTEASKLGAAYTQKAAGQGGLKEQLDTAQKTFEGRDPIRGKDQYGNYQDRSVVDLINNGAQSVNSVYSNGVNGFGLYGTNNGTSNPAKAIEKSQYDQLQKYLQEQNYGQTLGGRRETFLDSLPGYAAPNPKLDATPITGYDPSLGAGKDGTVNNSTVTPDKLKFNGTYKGAEMGKGANPVSSIANAAIDPTSTLNLVTNPGNAVQNIVKKKVLKSLKKRLHL